MNENSVYPALQEHLDRQAVGFPATRAGAELRFLQLVFTPDEARLALNLSYRPTTMQEIMKAASPPMTSPQMSPERVRELLDGMASKGAIGWKQTGGADLWFLMPLVIGMYEGQDGKVRPEFQAVVEEYMATREWGTALLAAAPSQMRTVPVGIEVPVRNHVASYDQIRAIVENASGPFAVLPCVCREAAAWKGNRCRKTTRTETCLGFGETAAMVLKRKHGREITREEVISILRDNEKDGLVLQPSNARDPVFVCSCCGCCCGMLGMQKRLPHPLAFWTTNFHAVVHPDACTGCGTCAERCQVNAVAVTPRSGTAVVDLNRCIGCGVCTATCASEAIRLEKNAAETVPPASPEELYDRIHAGRRGWVEAQVSVLRRLLGR